MSTSGKAKADAQAAMLEKTRNRLEALLAISNAACNGEASETADVRCGWCVC